jgi:hypothetical protein
MSAFERGVYVAVGAADLAAEKVRELPAVKLVVERAEKFRNTSIIEQAREIEPKFRQQAKELQVRGEAVVKRIRSEAKDFSGQVREFPEQARKQLQELPEKLQEFPDTARKQANEIRDRVEKRFGRTETAKPASKTSAAKSTSTTAKVS